MGTDLPCQGLKRIGLSFTLSDASQGPAAEVVEGQARLECRRGLNNEKRAALLFSG